MFRSGEFWKYVNYKIKVTPSDSEINSISTFICNCTSNSGNTGANVTVKPFSK